MITFKTAVNGTASNNPQKPRSFPPAKMLKTISKMHTYLSPIIFGVMMFPSIAGCQQQQIRYNPLAEHRLDSASATAGNPHESAEIRMNGNSSNDSARVVDSPL
jgi:hypothetical protein